MVDLKVIEERPINMVELKSKIAKIKKRDKELNFRSKKVSEYLNAFVELNEKEAKELSKKILELNIPRLKDRHVVKVLDILPKDIDSLKALFSGENITIKQEDLARILEVIK